MNGSEANGNPVRVRFAPSPTGYLHIGGLRTALYNYLLARRHNGVFILRIEDTDRERFVEDALSDIQKSLEWTGITVDEGPAAGGDFGPYYQSDRGELYQRYVQQLLDQGDAYYAFDTRDELEAMRESLRTRENPSPRYDAITRMQMRNSFTLSADEIQSLIDEQVPYVVRLRVPASRPISFVDHVRGEVTFQSDALDDQILMKSDGMPTYHMANVVDDHHMQITHIIRGEEWLSSTPKHILLYEFLGWEPPQMAHLPLIMSPTGGKLSKRNAEKMGIPVNVRQYIEAGYESEALINFLAFLGWNPGTEQEIFKLDELIDSFDLQRIGSAGVQFDLDKLRWFNQQHLMLMDNDKLQGRIKLVLDDAGLSCTEEYLNSITPLLQERLVFLSDVTNQWRYFFEDPTIYDEKGKKRWKKDTGTLLGEFADALESLTPFDAESCEKALESYISRREIGKGKIMFPVRYSISGIGHGPDLFDTMAVLGKEACIRRMRAAIAILG